MKRKFEDILLKWKSDGMKKPMMVVGVRQIGKTYTIDKFCRDNFKNYIYINLLDRRDIVKLYKEDISISDKIKKMEWIIGKKLDSDDTIFFVEYCNIRFFMLKCRCKEENNTDFYKNTCFFLNYNYLYIFSTYG